MTEENQVTATETTEAVKQPELATVTSIAEEEAKTGQKVELTEAQALEMAANQHTRGFREFQLRIAKLSNRGVNRVITALLQLPDLDDSGKMPSSLRDEEEKIAFLVGQQVQNAKFALFTGLIKSRRSLAMAEASAKQDSETKVEEVKVEGETNV